MSELGYGSPFVGDGVGGEGMMMVVLTMMREMKGFFRPVSQCSLVSSCIIPCFDSVALSGRMDLQRRSTMMIARRCFEEWAATLQRRSCASISTDPIPFLHLPANAMEVPSYCFGHTAC